MTGILDYQGNVQSITGLMADMNYTSKTWFLNVNYISKQSNIGGITSSLGYNIGRFQPYLAFGYSANPSIIDQDSLVTTTIQSNWYVGFGINISF
jgi:hypothetical protein